jgi:hypothetical protein
VSEIIDLSGKTFGRLYVIGIGERRGKKKEIYWNCKCECGNELMVRGRDIRIGHTQSCGCLHKEIVSENKIVNMEGQKFGRLTVLSRAEKPENKRTGIFWNCICDCGNSVIVSGRNLRKRHTKTCGCSYKDLGMRKRKSRGASAFNSLLLSYKVGAKSRGLEFELSEDDFRRLTQQVCFYCGKEPDQIKGATMVTGGYVYNGIDRVDSLKGYTLDNCVSCCGQCNVAKLNHSLDNFIAWIFRVHTNLLEKGITPTLQAETLLDL